MNKRIQELKDQAWATCEEPEQYMDKFAELLVKECAYLVNDQQRTTGYTTHAQMLCKEFNIEFKDEDYYGRQ